MVEDTIENQIKKMSSMFFITAIVACISAGFLICFNQWVNAIPLFIMSIVFAAIGKILMPAKEKESNKIL